MVGFRGGKRWAWRGEGKAQRAQPGKVASPVTAVAGCSAQTRARRGTSAWNPGAPLPAPGSVHYEHRRNGRTAGCSGGIHSHPRRLAAAHPER